MPGRPAAVFIFDMVQETNAVREARKLHIPVFGLVDTNADPNLADIAIPCNDDAIKTIELVADYLRQAVETGKAEAAKRAPAKDKDEKGE
jgi:small subunit ribosomal protein S2